MVLEYDKFQRIIMEHEEFYDRPFLGYISPRGGIVDYSILVGEPGHDNWRNPVTPLFLGFVSYVVLDHSLEFFKTKSADNLGYKRIYEKNKYDGAISINDFVLRGPSTFGSNDLYYDEFIDILSSIVSNSEDSFESIRDEWDYLKYDLLQFFKKCYSNRDFFYSFGRIVKVPCEKAVIEAYKTKWWLMDDVYAKKQFYEDYCMVTLMSYFKDIMVMYMGYDSIERAMPIGDLNIVNNLYEFSGGYGFSKYPTILTSCFNPNERFYEWQLHGWAIKRVPRMFWNEREHRFVRESLILEYHQTEKEAILGEYIRKRVPKEEIPEYFRR